jgi:hypothetical protein
MNALQVNTTAAFNSAFGWAALQNNNGNDNSAFGESSLKANLNGIYNVAAGSFAIQKNTSGSYNVGIGYNALGTATTGNSNIGLGSQAGVNLTVGNYNIMIGNQGLAADNLAIRIGDSNQTQAFISGIRGITTGNSDAVAVVIDSNGQLGTVNSSRRFKEDIQDMGEASSKLMNLRPVTYRYQRPYTDGAKPLDYGLIAEEVAEVYPDLVVKSADGQVETVQYQKLTPMLLNEVQRQQAEIVAQRDRIQSLDQQNQDLQKRLARLEAALASIAAEHRDR